MEYYVGMVRISGELGADLDRLAPVRFLVGTGAMYSFVSLELARALRVEFTASTSVITADGARLQVPLAFAYMRVMDREGTIILGAMNVPEPLLGATSLQILGLMVDPVNDRMGHSRFYDDIPVLAVAASAALRRVSGGVRGIPMR